MPLEDEIYIEQCKNGDNTGFFNLVNKYKGMIFSVILQRNIDRNNAEDLTQEVFIKAYNSIHKLKNPDKFASWLYGIAYHTSIDWIRKRKKEKTIDIEIMGMRIGDFILVTFPGEPSAEVGLNIKKKSPHKFTFIAGYSNGYIYYAPTEKQRKNTGFAQEDCDCLVAPEWQKLYEDKISAILKKL